MTIRRERNYKETFDHCGVKFKIRWSDFVIGSSIFIPSANVKKTMRQFRIHARILDIDVKHRAVIEKDLYGVRIWRVR
jgi:hypothetical protein